MNGRTILAFGLILVTLFIFSSSQYQEFFYTKILRKPVPQNLQKLPPEESSQTKNTVSGIESVPNNASEEALKSSISERNELISATSLISNDSLVLSQNMAIDTILVSTDKMICKISTLGARIVSLTTKEFKYTRADSSKNIELIPNKPDFGGCNISINKQSYDSALFTFNDSRSSVVIEGKNIKTIAFTTTLSNGQQLVKMFTFSGNSYQIDCKIQSQVLKGKDVTIGWLAGISESEQFVNKTTADQNLRTVHFSDGKQLEHLQEKKETREISGLNRWIGISSKYFIIALIGNQTQDGDLVIKPFPDVALNSLPGYEKSNFLNYQISRTTYCDADTYSVSFYAGPSRIKDLKAVGVGLETLLFGTVQGTFSHNVSMIFFRADLWFPVLCRWILELLNVLFAGVKDYGIVIILLTVLSKVVTFPMTHSSTKTMKRTASLQPKITKIRERYKSNPQKMNEEIFALYKAEGVNPFNPGCLPMIMQMPIFISLFVVLQKAIELRLAPTFILPWIHDLSQPEALPVLTPIFQQLVPGGLPMYGTTIALLPILNAVLTFFSTKMTMKDPNQKMMIWFMPIFMLIMFNSFPSGLCLYWTFQSGLGLLQTWLTNKYDKTPAPIIEVKKK